MFDMLKNAGMNKVLSTVMAEAAKLRLYKLALEDISQMPCVPGSANCGAAKRAKDVLAEAERIK